jgi:DNA-directed RNA polymerase subunit RPC12/RpoP
MPTPDYLKCPGSDPVSNAFPEFYTCPKCDTNIEIWTDESGAKCPACNAYFKKVQVQDISGALATNLKKRNTKLNDIVQKAIF